MACVNRFKFDVDKQAHTALLHLWNCGERLQITHASFGIPRVLYGSETTTLVCSICINYVLCVYHYASAMHLHIPLVKHQPF